MTRERLLSLEADLLSRLRAWPDEWERFRLMVEIQNVRWWLGRV